MKRTTKPPTTTHKQKNLPDIIHSSPAVDFTQIPNTLLRDPALSLRAKGLLCVLLSNRDGWRSYIPTLCSITSDGETTIRTTLNELETAGYLMRVRLRCPDTKAFTGSIWAYSNTAHQHDVARIERLANEAALEPVFRHSTQLKAKSGKAKFGLAKFGNPATNNTNNKNTKGKNTIEADARTYAGAYGHTGAPKQVEGLMPDQSLITPAMFEQWWRLYPRKVDKGKAKTKWGQICNRAQRPTFAQLRDAVNAQIKTDRWRRPQYIPHPTTWLNQERWLDDPAAMNDAPAPSAPAVDAPSPAEHAAQVLGSPLLAGQFMNDCVTPAVVWLGGAGDKATATDALLQLYAAVADAQRGFTPALRAALPGPMDVIETFIIWLNDNTWISDRAPRVFDAGGALFTRYRTWAATRDPFNRDPLTGAPVHRYE